MFCFNIVVIKFNYFCDISMNSYFSNKNLNIITLEMIETAAEAGVTSIDFSKNSISDIPEL